MPTTFDTDHEDAERRRAGAAGAGVSHWFVREVLPLEAALMQFLRRSLSNASDADDLCQDVYVRVYQAALEKIPNPAKPFVFTVARNLLLNRARHEAVVSIEAVADLEALNIVKDEPGTDRWVIAREELRRLEEALTRLTPRCRQAFVLRKIEGLSQREIAQRMGISEKTVERHISDGICALADFLFGEHTGRTR
ncbi:MAG TPA: RNA polymerase sigma factor [Rhizomicrobium sp.]